MKVDADTKPFLEVESHFADAKFYMKSDAISKVILTKVRVAKGSYRPEQRMVTTKKLSEVDALSRRGNDESMTQVKPEVPKNEGMISTQGKNSKSPVLRYVPLSRRKKGESPFAECSKNLMIGDIEILKESFTTPLTKMDKSDVKKTEKEEARATLPEQQTKDGFDPKTYKILAKAGYDFTAHIEFKSLKIFDERPELSSIQRKL